MYAVQKEDIDSSTFLPPVVDSSMTLTQCLAALEEITQRLQEDEQANCPVLYTPPQIPYGLHMDSINPPGLHLDSI